MNKKEKAEDIIKTIKNILEEDKKMYEEYIKQIIFLNESIKKLIENDIEIKIELTELNKNISKENKYIQLGIAFIVLMQTIFSILKLL